MALVQSDRPQEAIPMLLRAVELKLDSVLAYVRLGAAFKTLKMFEEASECFRTAVTLQPSNHPYLNGAWTPQHEEVTATYLEVIEGSIPDYIDGVYLRNTENPLFQAKGKYHPFDGDGMLHAMRFENGRAEYRNRFVRTTGFMAEEAAGESLWPGIIEPRRAVRRQNNPSKSIGSGNTTVDDRSPAMSCSAAK